MRRATIATFHLSEWRDTLYCLTIVTCCSAVLNPAWVDYVSLSVDYMWFTCFPLFVGCHCGFSVEHYDDWSAHETVTVCVCVCVCVRERERERREQIIKQETLIQDKFRGNTCNETLRTNLTLLLSESSCAGGWVLSLLNWTPGELSGSRPGMDSTHESCALNLWTPCRRSQMTCMAPGSPVCSLPWIWCHLGWAAAWALACMWSPGLWLRKWQDLEWSCPSLLQLWHPFCQVRLYDFS